MEFGRRGEVGVVIVLCGCFAIGLCTRENASQDLFI